MSTESVAAAMGAGPYAKAIEDTCIRYGIATELEKCHFLAQIAHETQGFTRFRENLNYSAERLLQVFRGRNGLTTLEQAHHIVARGTAGIAEAIYGGEWGKRNLGNDKPGDGAKYPGQGAIHLTGKANVRAYSRARYGDDRVVEDPTMLQRLPDIIDCGGWYWQANGIGAFARADNLVEVRRAINPGLLGLEDCKARLAQAKAAFARLRGV